MASQLEPCFHQGGVGGVIQLSFADFRAILIQTYFS